MLYVRFTRCLDLGCGTGLSGQAISTISDCIVGVDLSPAMVRRATEKNVYRRLLVGDITKTVSSLARRRDTLGIEWDAPDAMEEREQGGEQGGSQQSGDVKEVVPGHVRGSDVVGEGKSPSRAEATAAAGAAGAGDGRGVGDLVLSCDVFVYIGDLRPCFEAVRGLLEGGHGRGDEGGGGDDGSAYFAFSAEAPPNGDVGRTSLTSNCSDQGDGGRSPGYELQGTGR